MQNSANSTFIRNIFSKTQNGSNSTLYQILILDIINVKYSGNPHNVKCHKTSESQSSANSTFIRVFFFFFKIKKIEM